MIIYWFNNVFSNKIVLKHITAFSLDSDVSYLILTILYIFLYIVLFYNWRLFLSHLVKN